MSTTLVPAIDMDKLNAFIGQFVTDLGASVHTGMVVIGEKLGLYKALAGEALSSAQLAARTSTDDAMCASGWPHKQQLATSPTKQRPASSA